jgi:Spirocyclase AveC-like
MPTAELPRAPSLAGANRSHPVTYWALLGAALLCFEVYVLGSWVFGPHFVPTPTGPDTVSAGTLLFYRCIEVAVTGATVVCLFFWVVLPWRRQGRLTTDGMLAISCATIFFWDMCMNYTSVHLLYNSHFINFGAWANGAWPGWTSPNGHLLPEPIFVTLPGYACLVYSQVLVVCALLRWGKSRWPGLSVAGCIGLMILGLTIVDSVIEIALLRSGVYAYPGSIRALTLFAGETYQFPLTEGFFFGGLGLGAIAVLKFFRNDKGQTLAERGIEHLRVGDFSRQWIKFLAIFGFCHGMFALLYMVPNQWLATHSDPFPHGYPSYMLNGMCVSGEKRNECPGPGVAMPRPSSDSR